MDRLERISSEYRNTPSGSDPDVYYALVRRLVAAPHYPASGEAYYGLLEDLLFAIFDGGGGGTVGDDVAEVIMAGIRREWAGGKTDQQQASMIAIATVLLPRAIAKRWLEDAAASEPEARLAEFLKACAATVRRELVV